MDKKKFVVISHTHWDREWYKTFQQFRLKLVDLIDRLLIILEKNPNYIFHLDAQTIVLEDYLEIRKDKEELLKKYIKEGNIQVGPWYLQNDFYLTDGESTVKNLQIGIDIAKKFGKCSYVGYAPDQFGNVSQLPQILNGFGVDSFIFGRGARDFEQKDCQNVELHNPSEFIWQSEDGSKCLGVFLSCWYNNAQRFSQNIEKSKLLVDINENKFNGYNTSNYVLLMNGVDHLEAQDDILPILEQLRLEGYDIRQYSLEEYVNTVKESVNEKALPIRYGALNKGRDDEMLRGCWSSRIYLKQENIALEDLLKNKLEPLYTYLNQRGLKGIYPKDEMSYLWKELIKNHPHDSICGCSIDAVHDHMEDNFLRIQEMGEDLLERGMKTLSHHVESKYGEDKNYVISVFNPIEREYSGTIEVQLDFLANEKVRSFAIVDEDGNQVEYELIKSKKGERCVYSPLNLPGVIDVDVRVVRFNVNGVKPLSSKIYSVVVGKKGKVIKSKEDNDFIENDLYKIYFDNGIVVENKKTGKIYNNAIVLEDVADAGDAYVFQKGGDSPMLISPTFVGVKNDKLKKQLKVKFNYDCPIGYDFKNRNRKKKTVKELVDLTVELLDNSKTIDVSYSINNKAKDHRLRVVCAFGDGELLTDTAFDCDYRKEFEHCPVTASNTHFGYTFAYVKQSEYAVYNHGQFEFERAYNGLAMTILRSTGRICIYWAAEGNQCERKIDGRFGIDLNANEERAVLQANAKIYRFGAVVLTDSFDSKKYSGGRFAVQSSELEQLYFIKDKFEGIKVRNRSLIDYKGKDVAVSIVKTDINGNMIVRLVNLTSSKIFESFSFCGDCYLSDFSEENESYLGKDRVTISFKPKQIITLKIK